MRRHPIPVVAACIIKQHPLMFLMQRKKESEDEHGVQRNPELLGLWEFPGGMIEGRESPEQALEREIREELSITIQIDDLLLVRAASFRDKKPYLLIFYICHTSYEAVPDGCEYFRRIDNPGAVIPGDLEAIEALKKRYM